MVFFSWETLYYGIFGISLTAEVIMGVLLLVLVHYQWQKRNSTSKEYQQQRIPFGVLFGLAGGVLLYGLYVYWLWGALFPVDMFEACRGVKTPECTKHCPDWSACDHHNTTLVLHLNGTNNFPTNYRKATLKDFSYGEIPNKKCPVRAAGTVFVGFVYNYRSTSVYGQQELYFDQYVSSCSYITERGVSINILPHEQLHIDIYTVCYAMVFKRVKEHISSMTNPSNLRDPELVRLTAMWAHECREISHRMDDETGHGEADKWAIEARWRDFIEKKLEAKDNLHELYTFTAADKWWWWT